jgi:biotin/methionine sulfoxide reductase
VVHDPYFTAMARHADFVLPSTTSLEREDSRRGQQRRYLTARPRALEPSGAARDDYAIFLELAQRLGAEPAFSEGRSPREWLEHLYERWRAQLVERDVRLPPFAEFWANGDVELPVSSDGHTLFDRFRADPDGRRLATPSGRIEIFSERIDGFGYDDCPGHPTWMEPEEWLGGPRAKQFPLHLIANQPSTRLHSQLDAGDHSRASKIRGREPIRIHPTDAAARGIRDGDIVRVFSDRGACLAGALLSEDVRPSVVQLSTGAWVDLPTRPRSICVHGNPNAVTVDVGRRSSRRIDRPARWSGRTLRRRAAGGSRLRPTTCGWRLESRSA